MPLYLLGLDLGQAADFSALAILETPTGGPEADYHCRHLQRWPLKTPYPRIVADVARMVTGPELRGSRPPVLAVDATGVGAPVVDLFKQSLRLPRPHLTVIDEGYVPPPCDVQLCPIQITGGDAVTHDRASGVTRVPKRDLVSAAQVALQTGRLKIAEGLKEAATLTRELLNFQVKISLETAHDSYGAWREGAHDDLVLAVALALWQGANFRPVTVTEQERETFGRLGRWRGVGPM